MDYTKTTDIPSPIRTYYDQRLLQRLLPKLIHKAAADMRPLKMRSGDQIKFRRIESLTAQTAPLEEGVTPSPLVLDDTQITSTIAQYGGYSIITDMVQMTDIDPIVSETVGLVGEMMGNTIDRTIASVINAGTNYIRVTATNVGSTSGARTVVDNGVFTPYHLRAAVSTLENANVEKIKPMIKTGSGYASSPVPESYLMFIHPTIAAWLRGGDTTYWPTATSGFIPVQNYANYAGLYDGEIGAHVSGVRFIMSTNVKTWASTGADTVTVYSNLLVGKGFYACTEMAGGVRTYVHDRKTEGGPLEQRSTVGAIVEHVTTILNDSCAVRVECESKLAGT
jgi:N4-gp56 family major capsid protein